MSNLSVRGEQSTNTEITALTNLTNLPTSGAGEFIRKTGATTFENATPGGGAVWGSITGTLSNQTDLQTALNAKQASDAQLTSLAALSYTGNAGKFIRVNAGETDFELAAVTAGGITIGTTTITSGTTTRILYNNAGVVGEYVVGTGVSTALAINVGSAGAFVTFNGALGTPSSGTLTNATGLPIAGLVSSTSTALGVGSLELGHASDTTLTRVSAGVVAIEGVNIVTISATQTLTNKTLTTPVINGLPTGTGVASAATVSTLMSRDSSGNTNAVNMLEGYTTTATAAGTTTLTVASNNMQFFTGSTTQTVVMPVTSTLVLGQSWWITNLSSGAVTINSSGGNTILILAPGCSAEITCILTSGTTASSWNYMYEGSLVTSGKKLSVSNTLTLAGTDSTTMTFPSTSATIARTDAAQTFTGIQTITQIDLGNTDTSITRAAAGIIAVEGVNVPTISSTDTLSNKTLTAPKFANAGFIADANGNELMIFTTTASAVNEITLANGATGNNPSFTASGGDANVGFNFTMKGTGTFNIRGNATQPGELRLYEDTDLGTNYTAFKVGTQSADISYVLPTAQGGASTVLQNDGSGNLSWAAASGGSATAIDSTQSTYNTYLIVFSGSGSTPTGDTWDASAMGAGSRWNGNLMRCTFGTNSYISQFLAGNIGGSSNFFQFGNGKDVYISFNAIFGSVTNQVGIGIMDNVDVAYDVTQSGGKMMFRYTGSVLYATNGEAATNTSTDVSSGITVTNWNNYRIHYRYGTDIRFYINNTLVATHTTNMPTSSSNGRFVIGGKTSGDTSAFGNVVISVKQ